MQFDIQIAHSVEEIGQEAWDRLSQDRPFSSYRWYRYGEKVMGANLPIYIVLSVQNEPVARGTFWLVRNEPLPLSEPARSIFQIILQRWPLMICRSPLTEMSGLIVPESSLRDEALTTIVRVARDQAQQHRASFVAVTYLERQESEWDCWSNGFISFKFSEPGTCMNIAWPDFEGYLKHLSKSARKDYKRHCRFANEQGIRIIRGQTPAAGSLEFDKAMTLITNVTHRHDSPLPWARSMLEYAGMVGYTWITAEKDGSMVGCGILLEDGDHRLFKLIGLDYSVKYVYFQLFYERIRCAIEQGARFLWGGSGIYEFKQHIGFHMMNREYLVWTAMNTRVQKLVRVLIHRFLN